MPKDYICDLCKKGFKQSIDLKRHKDKKAPCISLEEMKTLTKKAESKADDKSKLTNLFKACLDDLRAEGLTGEKALRNMSYLLVFKLIEPHLDTEIKINDYPFEFNDIDDEDKDEHRSVLLDATRFSNFAKEKEVDMSEMAAAIWKDILSVHPATKNIFLKGKKFDITRGSTFKKLVTRLNKLDLSETEHDVLGGAYEEVIQDIMTGKVLGQFFTPSLVKNMMVKLLDPQIHPDGKIDVCGDPTMGTGGFLISCMKYIMKQAEIKNITPDWDYIKTTGLYGKELEPDTYQLAVSNMLISSGHMFEHMERGDSIRDPITKKFDIILANPPFGIKGLKYKDIESALRDEYLPIKTDNAVSLFLQAIIYMLKINGKCAIVLPDGKDLFSKTDKTLVLIREYLVKTCDLKEIIYMPSGIFTNTTIKTCVFYFIKKAEGSNVLTTETKITRSKKEFSRDYTFSKSHKTARVKFYDYNPYNEVKNLLADVPIRKIAKNSYSLNYAEYIKDDKAEKYSDEIQIKTLGEVCEINQGKSLTKSEMENGKYNVIGGGKIIGKHTNKNRDGDDFVIARVGDMQIHFMIEPYYLTDNGFSIKSLTNHISTKYIYYYILHNMCLIENMYKGTAQKVISKSSLSDIQIPIPCLEKQNEIVQHLDAINSDNDAITATLNIYKRSNSDRIELQKLTGENKEMKLGELFGLNGNGKTNSGDISNTGEYPFYKASCENPSGTHKTYDFDGLEYLLIVKSGGSAAKPFSKDYGIGKVFLVHNKCAANIAVFQLLPKTDNSIKYLYYYLISIQLEIQKLAKYCTNNGNIDMKDLMEIKILVPPIAHQLAIVEECEKNDTVIELLEERLNKSNELAKKFLELMLKPKELDETKEPEQKVQEIEIFEEPDENGDIIIEVDEQVKTKRAVTRRKVEPQVEGPRILSRRKTVKPLESSPEKEEPESTDVEEIKEPEPYPVVKKTVRKAKK